MSRRFTWPVLFIAVFINLNTAVSAFTETDHERIRTLYSQRNYSAAAGELENLRAADTVRFELNNYDYLLARSLHKDGQLGRALPVYQHVASRNSILRGYALWHLAEIARAHGNPLLERIYLSESRLAGGLVRHAAAHRIARSHLSAGDFARASYELNSLLRGTSTDTGNTDRLAREALVLLAESYVGLNDRQAARNAYGRLLNETPDADQPDDHALAGARGLDLLDATEPTTPKLSPDDHRRRGWAYQFNREFENARRHYIAIVNEHPPGNHTPDAVFQIGRGYAQANDFTEAVRWFERLQEQFPESELAPDAILQAASGYARLGKYKESASRYQMFIERFPTDARLDRAYLNMIDIARDQGEEVAALRRAENAAAAFAGKTGEAQARFAEARIYIAREEWRPAAETLSRVETLNDLGGVRVPGGTSVSEIRFLRGVVAEKLLDWNTAVDLYLSIPDGRNEYFGSLATERLQALSSVDDTRPMIDAVRNAARVAGASGDAAARKQAIHRELRLTADENVRRELIERLRAVYAELPEYSGFETPGEISVGRKDILDTESPRPNTAWTIGGELAFLGLWDEAAPEIESAGLEKDPAKLARIYLAGDHADRAIGYAEPRFKLPNDIRVELLPASVTEMLYPVPFARDLVRYASERSVDPRFLLAIMRQESRYRSTAKSNAAARGLMQFIPSTSSRIAGQLQVAQFRQDDLYDPSVATLFGSQYVSNIFALYPNQRAAVAASYNAGEDNMKRWLGRSRAGSDPGRYVPEIMYSQTKDYVFKVMSNYRVYSELYNESLQRK
jgi:tetratricopeptide (TPR) repeat protein